LTFTTANWNTPQTVTVTAVDDSMVEGVHAATITHTAASTDPNFNGIPISGVTTYITDNDQVQPGITVTKPGVSVKEGGATDTYVVVLNSVPSAPVSITLSPNSQYTAVPSTFTLSAANMSQLVTVAAVDDDVVEAVQMPSITHTVTSSDPAYNGIAIPSVTVTVTDNDVLPPPTEGTFTPGPPGGEGSFSEDRQVRHTRLILGPFFRDGSQNRVVLNVAHRQQATVENERSIPAWAITMTGIVFVLGAFVFVVKARR
jgi:hypothetical protein